MTIILTKIHKRPTANDPFFNHESTNTAMTNTKLKFQSLVDSGNYSRETNISEDGLTDTTVYKFADLETWSAFHTIMGIEFDNGYLEVTEGGHDELYNKETWQERRYCGEFYNIVGIDAPIRVITIYTFPQNTEEFKNIFAKKLKSYDHRNKLDKLIVGKTAVVITHKYDNGKDYVANRFSDLTEFVPDLARHKVTRTIKFEYL